MERGRGYSKLTRIELSLFLRDPFATVFALVLPLIMLLLLAAVFGGSAAGERDEQGRLVFRGIAGADYYMTASVALVIAAIGLLTIPIHLAGYREAGILRRFRASSIPGWSLFGSQIGVALAIGAAGSVIIIAVAMTVYSTRFSRFSCWGVSRHFRLDALLRRNRILDGSAGADGPCDARDQPDPLFPILDGFWHSTATRRSAE